MKVSFRHLRGFYLFVLVCMVGLSVGIHAQNAPPPTPGTSPAPKTPGQKAPVSMPPEVQKAAAQYTRAVALHRAKKFSEALTAYQEFLRLAEVAKLPAPTKLQAYQNIAGIYEAQRDQKGLETTLLAIVKIAPTNAEAYAQLATLVAGQKRFEEAKRHANRALQLSPNGRTAAPAHFALGTIAAIQEDLVTAEKEFGLAVQLSSKNPQALYNYAIILGKLGKLKQALAVAEKTKALDPKLLPVRLYIATLKHQLKDIPGAISAYEDTLKLDPRSPFALFNRATLLQQMGRTNEAISGYLKLLEVQPNHYGAHLNIAQLYYALGNYTATKQHYATARKLDSKDIRVVSSLAVAEMQEAMTQSDPKLREAGLKQAETHFKEVLAKDAKEKTAQSGLGYLYEQSGRVEDAMTLYRKRLLTDPSNVESYRAIARAYTMQRNSSKVLETWKAYRFLKPDEAVSYTEPAAILEAEGKWTEAMEEWRALLARQPKDANSMVHIARDWVQLKKPEEAKKQLLTEIMLDTTGADAPEPKERQSLRAARESYHLQALHLLAEIAQTDNQWEEALRWLNQAKQKEAAIATRNGTSPTALTYRQIAQVYEKSQKFDLAEKEYQALAILTPNDPAAFADLAQMFEGRGQIDDAAGAYRKAIAVAKDPILYQIRIGEMYRSHNKIEVALAEYAAARNRTPKEPRILTPLAQLYEQTGKNELALTTYQALLQASPTSTWVEDRKAILYSRLKRYSEARALYERIIERNPENPVPYADLARLYAEEGRPAAYLTWLQGHFEKNPTRSVLMASVMDAFTLQKQEEAGWTYLRGFVEKHASQKGIQHNFAELLLRRNHVLEALALYRRIAAQNPKDLKAQTELADQIAFYGKKEEAIQFYLDLIARPELTPIERVPLHRRASELYQQLGKKAEAILQYQEIVKAQPREFVASSSLAQLLVDANRASEAIPLYTRLGKEEGYPPNLRAFALVQLGSIYEKQGDKDAARKQFQEALKVYPQDNNATNGLKRVGEK